MKGISRTSNIAKPKGSVTFSKYRCRCQSSLRLTVIGAYISVFDFLLKNYFQSDQSLYAFKKQELLLSSHLVHLNDLTPASCIGIC